MTQLLLGTNNPGKIREIKALLESLPLDLVTPQSLGIEFMVDEHGRSYMENAMAKALAWSIRTQMPTLADDSGLEVKALNGAPGLHSHRFTGAEDASDADRRRYLLERLILLPRPWSARFVCAAVLAIPGLAPITSLGICRGEIIPKERGTNGFGYDSIFLVNHTGKTMAELSFRQKNRISHRSQAIMNIHPILIEKLQLI